MDILEETPNQELSPQDMNKILGNLIMIIFITFLLQEKSEWNYKLHDKKVFLGIFQEKGFDYCDRHNVRPSENLLYDPSVWSISIPHPQDSGRCFTYKYKILSTSLG